MLMEVVNSNDLSQIILIYHSPWYITINCGEQTVVPYQGFAVYNNKDHKGHTSMSSEVHSTSVNYFTTDVTFRIQVQTSENTRSLFYPLNFIYLSARYNILVLTVNTVGIPTCSQHLLTCFVRRPDDGHIRTETCSLTHNKYDVFDVNCFIILTHSLPAI